MNVYERGSSLLWGGLIMFCLGLAHRHRQVVEMLRHASHFAVIAELREFRVSLMYLLFLFF